ncbi:MAG: hypothetical protein N2422_02785 [Rhodobacteraceae bacterium]|nr:hypothetical protein [Paracoccaceae bacterium]
MRRILFAAAALSLLSACEEPPAACNSAAARELATVDRLIAETRADIARGYRLETAPPANVAFCVGGQNNNVGLSFCSDGARTRKVPIDPAAEKRKLDNLEARRSALAAQAEADRRACAAGQA